MASTIDVYPRVGTTYLDAHDVPITSAGATVPLSAYIEDAIRRGDLLTYDPLEVYDPDDRSGQGDPGSAAPTNAEYIVAAANATLTNERVLTAGAGITLTPGAGTLTVASTAGGAPSNAGYIVTALDATLTNERRLVGGSGINIADGGPGSDLTISATGGGGGGAPTDAKYVVTQAHAGLTEELVLTAGTGISIGSAGGQVLVGATSYDATFVTMSAHANVPNERVLTAGSGISIADGGPGGAVTISATGGSAGAPSDASYLTLGTNGTLTQERVLTAGTGISFNDTGANGSLTISNTGAPVDAEYLVGSSNGTLTNERVLQAGSGITLTPSAGALTIAATGGSGSGLNGVIDLSSYPGVTRGTLANNTARQANRTAINAAIADAAAQNKQLLVPPGVYEIHGAAIVINVSGLVWKGSPRATFIQYSNNIPVIHVGPPLGTGGGAVVEQVIFDGAELKYSGTGVAGANALECTGVWMSKFANIDIGDVNAPFSSRVSVPYRGIYLDGTNGTTPCFSNVWENIRIKHFVYRGLDADRPSFDAASTGSVFINIYVSGGDSSGQQDTSGTAGAKPVYFQMQSQLNIIQLNIEWLKAECAMELDTTRQATLVGINIEGVQLKNGSSAESGFIQLLSGHVELKGGVIYNCTVSSANNVSAGSVLRCYDDVYCRVDNFRVDLTTKSGTTFDFVRNMTGSGNADVRVALNGLHLNAHALDRIDNFTFSGGNTGDLFETAGDFSNTTALTLSDATQTHYTYHQPGLLRMTPTSVRTLTLARQISSTDTCRIPRGATRRVRRVGGAANLVVANYDGSTLVTMSTADRTAEFVFDGTNWLFNGLSGG